MQTFALPTFLALACAANVLADEAVTTQTPPPAPTAVPPKSNVCQDFADAELVMTACGTSTCSGAVMRVPLRKAFQLCDPCGRSMGMMAVIHEERGAFAVSPVGMGVTLLKEGECVDGYKLEKKDKPKVSEVPEVAPRREAAVLGEPAVVAGTADSTKAARIKAAQENRRVAVSGDWTIFLVLVVAVLGYVVFVSSDADELRAPPLSPRGLPKAVHLRI